MNSGVVVLNLMVHRYKRLYLAFPAFLILLAGIGQLPMPWLPGPFAGILAVPFFLGLLMTVFGFVNVEADITSPASACSPWLLRLPVKTTTLAFWPIAAAAIWASTSWVVFSALFVRQRGIEIAIWWPAAMFTALALNLQAIMWAPFRRWSSRLILAITFPLAISLFGEIAMDSGWTAERVVLVYLVVAAGSALAAWVGVSRARTSPSSGFSSAGSSFSTAQEVKIRPVRRPFRSPQAAQFWLEWRRQGRLLPILTAFGLLAMSLPLLFWHDVDHLPGGSPWRVNIWMTHSIGYLPYIPLLFASVIGLGARPGDLRGPDGVYHLYHATRPLSEADLYRAKIRAITLGVLVTALLTMLVILIWLWLPAYNNDNSSIPYAKIFVGSFDRRAWELVAGFAVAVTAWTWRNQVVGAFVDFLPSRKIATTYPLFVVFTGAVMFVLFGASGQYRENPDFIWYFRIAVGTLLAAKMCLAVGFAAKLLRLRPSASREICWVFARWLATAIVAATTFGLIVYGQPVGSISPCYTHPVPEIVGILLVPLARPLAARIALELGRHR